MLKKIIMIVVTIVAIAGCSSTPSSGKIEKLYFDAMGGKDNEICKFENFKKNNGLKENENTYIAEISYDIVFKKSLVEIKNEMNDGKQKEQLPGFVNILGLLLTYGDFKAGERQHKDVKVTLIKKEKGWEIVNQN